MRAAVDRYAAALGQHLGTLPTEQVVPMRRLGRTVGTLFTQRGPLATAEAVLGAACELVGTDSGAVVSTGDRTTVVAATGPLAPALETLGVDHLDHLVELLDPVTSCYSSGEATGLAFAGGEPLRAAGACAVVVLPLGAGDRRTGLLLLAHTSPLALGADVIEPAELLAAVAGSCLENAEHVAAIEHQARLDPLTGLPNHASFHEALRAERTGTGFAVAMFDVDRFKRVNDTRGHIFGDDLLAATADAMAARLPAGATLYRVGGDEFAVLIPVDGMRRGQDAVVAVEVLSEAARAILRVHKAGISAGVAWQNRDEEPIDTLRRADSALYVAKATGGGVRRAGAPTRPSHAAAAPFPTPERTGGRPRPAGSAPAQRVAMRATRATRRSCISAAGRCARAPWPGSTQRNAASPASAVSDRGLLGPRVPARAPEGGEVGAALAPGQRVAA